MARLKVSLRYSIILLLILSLIEFIIEVADAKLVLRVFGNTGLSNMLYVTTVYLFMSPVVEEFTKRRAHIKGEQCLFCFVTLLNLFEFISWVAVSGYSALGRVPACMMHYSTIYFHRRYSLLIPVIFHAGFNALVYSVQYAVFY